jgi:hypothetical protein
VHFHPSEGLQVCFVVHDCLWQSILTRGDHRVYLVRNEAKDQRVCAFIAHVLRSPLRWYIKSAILEALCGEAVTAANGRNPLRVAPTANDIFTLHALVDRFESTVAKVCWLLLTGIPARLPGCALAPLDLCDPCLLLLAERPAVCLAG